MIDHRDVSSAVTPPARRSGRRNWLRGAGLFWGSASMSGWMPSLAATADRTSPKSVVLLWLNGGPSTIDLWDLKTGHEHGGAFRPIKTSIPGIEISEHLPKLADRMGDLTLIRSMHSPDGDHDRATHLLRTGYPPQAGIRFPAVGASLSKELTPRTGALPRFISIAPSRYASTLGGGFLGPSSAPFRIGRAGGTVAGLRVEDLARPSSVNPIRRERRLDLLNRFERQAAIPTDDPVGLGLQEATERAIRLMSPESAAAFDLAEESDEDRDRYGRNLFGQGCLLARRLVERGVSFVEVTLDGWDTHRDNFGRTAALSQTLDTAMSSLLIDLERRDRLGSTLVICQGEFGRTPKINANGGRDHWPHAWSMAMAGGGIAGGRVVGETSRDGTEITDRPVSVPDLVATVATVVGVDPRKQNMSNVSRPIRIVNPEGEPLPEVMG